MFKASLSLHRIAGKRPGLFPSGSFNQLNFYTCFITFHSCKSSNIPGGKECEIPQRFLNGILGWVIPRKDPPKQKDVLELLAKRDAKFYDILKRLTSGQVSIQCCLAWREEKRFGLR